ncbi:MAG TPA: hypothetical protein VN441_14520 [Syntrophomonas sp.]|nr:hypothetical protein [Syntrophomonas sp.]
MLERYKHEILNQEHKTISGYYTITHEIRLPFQGREVLYVVGYAEVDTSCCGTGTIRYALVAGYIASWKQPQADGSFISQVELIREEDQRTKIESIIINREIVSQVSFL